MAYSGMTISIPCNRGGLTYKANIDSINIFDMIPPTRNIDLDENGRRKRRGTACKQYSDYDDSITGTPQIMGLYNFRLYDGTDFIVVAGKDGRLYSAHSTTIKTGMSTSNYFAFETFENELYIVDGATVPQIWTGTGNTSNMTDIPTDWSGANQPQWIVKHGRGNLEKLWAGGVAAFPGRIYAGDGADFSDLNVTTLNIETGDGFGIIGAVEFGERILAFGKRKVYIIDDLDADTTNWGYDAVQWEGGACNFRCIVKTQNDIIAMMEDGEIYSVSAAQTYGDYKSASLLRPSSMHRWVREFVDLSQFDKFHGIFDWYQRCVRFFVVRKGETQVDTCLKYYIDRPVEEAWMVDSNETFNSGFSASVSSSVRTSAGTWDVVTGDYTGDIWKLNQETKSDSGDGYYSGFKTPNLAFENNRVRKNFKRGFIVTKEEGDWTLKVKWWVDGITQVVRESPLSGNGAALGSFVLGVDTLSGEELFDVGYDLGNTGKRIQYEVYNTNADEDFFISQLITDYKLIGAKPR